MIIVNLYWNEIAGLDARVEVQKSKTNISASLKDITVFDPVPDALYPKVERVLLFIAIKEAKNGK